MDGRDEERPDQDPRDRPFAAVDDDEAPAGDTDAAPITTASPLMAGMTGGPPGALGSTGAAGETTRIPETKEPEPQPEP